MVTVSRQAGAGGDEMARLLAQELGWRLLDNEGVERLLVEKGFGRPQIEVFDERNPGVWHRFSPEKYHYLQLLKLVSYEFARRGSCIIVGRGAQILFADVPGVIRVRVVAPLPDRVSRTRQVDGDDERTARQAVQQADSQRAGFYRLLFHADWDSPDLYDLIVNTHLVSVRTAVDLITRILSAAETREQKAAASRRLENLFLAQEAVVAILFEEKLPIHGLQIVVEDATVRLEGTTQDHSSIERAQEVAAGLCNAGKIDNEIRFGPRFAEILAGVHQGAASKGVV